mgnify:CR=1 FL=1
MIELLLNISRKRKRINGTHIKWNVIKKCVPNKKRTHKKITTFIESITHVMNSLNFYWMIKARFASDGRPLFLFCPKGMFLASLGAMTSFNLINIPITCLHWFNLRYKWACTCWRCQSCWINNDMPNTALKFSCSYSSKKRHLQSACRNLRRIFAE